MDSSQNEKIHQKAQLLSSVLKCLQYVGLHY